MKPYISIVVAVYNGEKYLNKCLNGIQEQLFKNFEVVFVDDASTDNSGKIIAEFQKENSSLEINYIRLEKNKGITNAKNTGVLNAKGIYILFHDQDDWMEKDCLKILADAAKKTNADKIVGRYQEVDENEKVLREVDYPANFSKWFGTALHAVLFRKSILSEKSVLCPVATQMEDGWINSHFAKYTDNITYVPKVVFNYLIRPDSTSGAKNNSDKWNSTSLFKAALDCFYPLYRNASKIEDKIDIEYMVAKQYYFYLLHNNRYVTWREAVHNWKRAQRLLLSKFPDYKKNPNIYLFKNNRDRKRGRILTWILCKVEKWHLMGFFWGAYLLISKFVYL